MDTTWVVGVVVAASLLLAVVWFVARSHQRDGIERKQEGGPKRKEQREEKRQPRKERREEKRRPRRELE